MAYLFAYASIGVQRELAGAIGGVVSFSDGTNFKAAQRLACCDFLREARESRSASAGFTKQRISGRQSNVSWSGIKALTCFWSIGYRLATGIDSEALPLALMLHLETALEQVHEAFRNLGQRNRSS